MMSRRWSSLVGVPPQVPLCAGVLVTDRLPGGPRRLLLSLADADLLSADHGGWRLTGVGGGADRGESPLACAQREALEEVGVPVTICAATRGWHVRADGTARPLQPDRWQQGPLPALVREVALTPGTPRRPGQFGDILWVVLYDAQLDPAARAGLSPVDVAGLVWMPWDLLGGAADRVIPVAELEQAGGTLVLHPTRGTPVPVALRWMHGDSEAVWHRLVQTSSGG